MSAGTPLAGPGKSMTSLPSSTADGKSAKSCWIVLRCGVVSGVATTGGVVLTGGLEAGGAAVGSEATLLLLLEEGEVMKLLVLVALEIGAVAALLLEVLGPEKATVTACLRSILAVRILKTRPTSCSCCGPAFPPCHEPSRASCASERACVP